VAEESAPDQSETLYKTLFDNSLTGNWVSTPDGRIQMCNEALAGILGFETVGALTRANLHALWERPADRDVMLVRLRERRRLDLYPLRLRHRDGRTLQTVANIAGVFDDAGTLTEVHGQLFDDTERLAKERERFRTQKNDALGRLAGGVAHDFNNLLTVILGYAETMIESRDARPSSVLLQDLAAIVDAAERGAALTRQMLDFSRAAGDGAAALDGPRPEAAPGGYFPAGAPLGPTPPSALGPAADEDATILVVEDDPSVMEFAARLLRRSGYRVLEAPTAEDALERFNQSDAIHLVMTDIMLPGMNGRDLATQVRERFLDTPILLCSGNPDQVSRPEDLRNAGFPLIEKAFPASALLETVHVLLAADHTGGLPASHQTTR